MLRQQKSETTAPSITTLISNETQQRGSFSPDDCYESEGFFKFQYTVSSSLANSFTPIDWKLKSRVTIAGRRLASRRLNTGNRCEHSRDILCI